MEIVIIAAVAANGVIGADGELPWHLPEDLRRFKATTMGHPVIMGRRTYEGIVNRLGEPLPGRTNVVLSRGEPPLPAGVRHASSIDEAIEIARQLDDLTYIIGGASVYEGFLPRADRLELTEIDAAFEGDTYFPERDEGAWVEIDRDDRDGFAFVVYERTDVA